VPVAPGATPVVAVARPTALALQPLAEGGRQLGQPGAALEPGVGQHEVRQRLRREPPAGAQAAVQRVVELARGVGPAEREGGHEERPGVVVVARRAQEPAGGLAPALERVRVDERQAGAATCRPCRA
jgi:hypothetical protein